MHIDRDKWTNYLRQYSLHYMVIALSALLGAYADLILVPRTASLRFRKDDPSISKSYVEDELVSTPECIAMTLVLGALIIFGYCTAGKRYLRKTASATWSGSKPDGISKEWHLLHLSLMCQLLSLSVTAALTCALKLLIGNTRPDFLARCELRTGTVASQDIMPFYTIDNCQQTDMAILHEGLKSTPSGHSSLITCGLGFLYLWQCRFVTGTRKRHAWCLILALLVMLSRVVDHKHHWYDLVFGSALGYTVLLFAWRSIFESGAPTLLPIPVTYA